MQTRNRYCSIVEAEYRRALNSLVCVTPLSACQPYLEQAKHDRDTKDLIIHSMLPILFQYAMRIRLRDPMDLVSVGNMVLIEEWEQAQTQEMPLRYLLYRAKMAMHAYLRQYECGPITFPDSGDMEYPHYDFFHIFDKLDTDDIVEPQQSRDTPMDSTPLYEALASLSSETARVLIERLFGLFDRSPETMREITGEDNKGTINSAKRVQKTYTLRKMKEYLVEHYPDFVEQHACASLEEKGRARATARLYEIGKIPQSARKRLNAARERIEARGQSLTVRALRAEAAVGQTALSAYLYELRLKDG